MKDLMTHLRDLYLEEHPEIEPAALAVVNEFCLAASVLFTANPIIATGYSDGGSCATLFDRTQVVLYPFPKSTARSSPAFEMNRPRSNGGGDMEATSTVPITQG